MPEVAVLAKQFAVVRGHDDPRVPGHEVVEPAEDTVEVCVYLYLPSHADIGETIEVAGVEFEVEEADSPGNLVQGASFVGSVDFAAEQCRHNENPFGGTYNVSDNAPPVPLEVPE